MNLFARYWRLREGLDFLNHGSFGACPVAVLARQQELREQLEAQPVEFLARRLPDRLDEAREQLALFLGADAAGLVPVANATTGINTVLRSFTFTSGDELLTTDHAYRACRNTLEFVTRRSGARLVVARVPFPLRGPEDVVQAVLERVSPRTRLAVLDHVTSPTGMVLPIATLIDRLAEQGIDTLVDGAHAPGMLPLDLGRLRASYYTGNCHKWLCAPKGAAFLHVREDRRDAVHPLTTSHGLDGARPQRSRFHAEFDWVGTTDPTAFLCVPTAIEHVGSLVDGGWPEVRSRNADLARRARRILASALDVALPCPDAMIESLAALPLPDEIPGRTGSPLYADPLHEALVERHRIEVPILSWPAPPQRLLRISAQLYNHEEQYERLGRALRAELRDSASGPAGVRLEGGAGP